MMLGKYASIAAQLKPPFLIEYIQKTGSKAEIAAADEAEEVAEDRGCDRRDCRGPWHRDGGEGR